MLQQHLAADKDQNNAAGQRGLVLILSAKTVANKYAQR